MTPWMRKIHKWVGLIIAIQFVLWVSSGVVMSLLDSKKVAGREFRIKPEASALWPGNALPVDTVLAKSTAQVMNISSGWLLGQPVYRLVNDKATWMIDAVQGTPVALDAALASGLSGPGRLHDLLVNVYAATPGELRGGGADLVIRHGFAPTACGECLVGLTARGLCHLAFVASGGRAGALDELAARKARLESERDGNESVKFPNALLARAGNPDVAPIVDGDRNARSDQF